MQKKLNKQFPEDKGERMCYMKKHVSDYLNKGVKGHFNYEFVDVIVNDDNLLFSKYPRQFLGCREFLVLFNNNRISFCL